MISATPLEHPSDAARLESIEGRWTLQILLCLNRGEFRFSDLKDAIPRISSNVLTDRIRELQSSGLVERHYLPPPTARYLYRLGPQANGLKSVLDALARWHSEDLSADGRAYEKEKRQ